MRCGAPILLAAVWLSSGAAGLARADVFSMPAGQTSMGLVTVGDAGNAADSTGFGAVSYSYQIGKFDVTAAQYAQFLNAVATMSDPQKLYLPAMGSGIRACGIIQSGGPGDFTYSVAAGHQNYPVNNVSWVSAVSFCNWLTNGQPTGVEGAATTEGGSYNISGGIQSITRSAGAVYAIPTVDEWYKAAYYKGKSSDAGYWLFPTQSNSIPNNALTAQGTNNANFLKAGTNNGYTDPANYLTDVGVFASSPGPYGTFDQGGDVEQWNEAVVDAEDRGIRGGNFNDGFGPLESTSRDSLGVDEGLDEVGFRIVEVPEPGTAGWLAIASLYLFVRPRRAFR